MFMLGGTSGASEVSAGAATSGIVFVVSKMSEPFPFLPGAAGPPSSPSRRNTLRRGRLAAVGGGSMKCSVLTCLMALCFCEKSALQPGQEQVRRPQGPSLVRVRAG